MGIQSKDNSGLIMKILMSLLSVSVLAAPSLNRDDDCSKLEPKIREALQTEFNVEIPEGMLDCVYAGDNCPFESSEDFITWFKKTTGLQIPDADDLPGADDLPDVDDLPDADDLLDADYIEKIVDLLDCPIPKEALDFVQSKLEAILDDETIQAISNCFIEVEEEIEDEIEEY